MDIRVSDEAIEAIKAKGGTVAVDFIPPVG